MTPYEIREEFSEPAQRANGGMDEGEIRLGAVLGEMAAQLAEIAAQLADVSLLDARRNELLDEQVGYQAETLKLQLNAMAEQKDPGFQAATMIAMQTGMQEVLTLWNREHPLQRIELQRPAPGAPQPGPRGPVRA
jgi:hypothetical protein